MGHSLVPIDPTLPLSILSDSPSLWRSSVNVGGSPGVMDVFVCFLSLIPPFALLSLMHPLKPPSPTPTLTPPIHPSPASPLNQANLTVTSPYPRTTSRMIP